MGKKVNYFDDDFDVDQLVKAYEDKYEHENDMIRQRRSQIQRENYEKRQKEQMRSAKLHKAGDKLKGIATSGGRLAKKFAHNVSDRVLFSEDNDKLKLAILAGCLVFVMVIIVGSVGLSYNHSVKKTQHYYQDAGRVCAQYSARYGNSSYEKVYNRYEAIGYRLTGLCYVRQMDFDDNGTDELLVCYDDNGEYVVEVWGNNKEHHFSRLYRGKAAAVKHEAWISIYFKDSKYYMCEHNEEDISDVSAYRLKDGSFEKDFTCTYDDGLGDFSIDGKQQSDNFDRVRLSILHEQKAIRTSNEVSDLIDSYIDKGEAKVKISSDQSLKEAYLQIVNDHLQQYGEPKVKKGSSYKYIDGVAYVKQIDFDGDGKNELMIAYRRPVIVREEDSHGSYVAVTRDTYYCEVYKYNGKNAVMVYQKDSPSNLLNDKKAAYIITKKAGKKYRICTNHFSSSNYGRILDAKSVVLKFDGERFVTQKKYSYQSEYGYMNYYIDGRSVYSSTFKEEAYDVPLFDGTDNYDASVYDVIYLQQRTSSTEEMDATVALTQSEINKLK